TEGSSIENGENNPMAERISTERARELIRDGDPTQLTTEAGDELNHSVTKEFRVNQGRLRGALENWPILLRSMIGAKTGRTLVRPLCYSPDGDSIVITASYGGAPRNPPWYYNLTANPTVTVEVGTEKFRARAAEVYGAERARLFDAAAKLLPL